MSVAIHIKNAVKKYQDATVIPNLSLDVRNRENEKSLMPGIRNQLEDYTGR